MLANGADNTDLDLSKTLKFVEAKEAGKRSSNLLTTAGGLNKMSEFQNIFLKTSIPTELQPLTRGSVVGVVWLDTEDGPQYNSAKKSANPSIIHMRSVLQLGTMNLCTKARRKQVRD